MANPNPKTPVAQGYVAIVAAMSGGHVMRTGDTKLTEQRATELARSAKLLWGAVQTVWGEE